MIDYHIGVSQVNLLFKLRGSVLPKAFCWAFPSAVLSFMISHYYPNGGAGTEEFAGVQTMWSSFTFIVGFLVVFRTQQAYGRYWEGATLLRQARGEWFNAYSSLIAFSSKEPTKEAEVESFQHLLVRLLSMLNCVALQTITDMADDTFAIVDTRGIDVPSLKYLASKTDHNHRMEILIQWTQRLVVESMNSGVLVVPPPIITRFFQETSRGAVCITRARNLTEIPFPFPYAQLLTLLLVLNCAVTPFISAAVMQNGVVASFFTFVLVFSTWSCCYIAAEIESPFGDDMNDLPLKRMQEDFNASLWNLLEEPAQRTPSYQFNPEVHRRFSLRSVSFSIVEEEEAVSDCTSARLERASSIYSKMSDMSLNSSLPGGVSWITRTKKHDRKLGFAGSHPQPPTKLHRRPSVDVSCNSNCDEYEAAAARWTAEAADTDEVDRQLSYEMDRELSESMRSAVRSTDCAAVAEEPSPQLPHPPAEPFEDRISLGASSLSGDNQPLKDRISSGPSSLSGDNQPLKAHQCPADSGRGADVEVVRSDI